MILPTERTFFGTPQPILYATETPMRMPYGLPMDLKIAVGAISFTDSTMGHQELWERLKAMLPEVCFIWRYVITDWKL